MHLKLFAVSNETSTSPARGDLRAKSISLSGVLCNVTAFVGVSERIYRAAAEPEPATELGLPEMEDEVAHTFPILRHAPRAWAFDFAGRLAAAAAPPPPQCRRLAAALHEDDAAAPQDEGSLDLSVISPGWEVSGASARPVMSAAPPSRHVPAAPRPPVSEASPSYQQFAPPPPPGS
jgi:hypothetical protein